MPRPLPKCKLCKTKDANQTGSHTLTAWLIASIFSKGKETRDHEVMYEIAPFDSKVPFIGRDVSPDTIEDNLGRALTDEEIKNQENKLVVDNLLCSDCEKRFKSIEDEYLNKVHKVIESSENDNSTFFESDHSNSIRLFFFSQIWRVSACGNLNFTLDKKFEEKLRALLNEILDIKIKNTLERAQFKSEEINSMPLCIIKSSKDITPTSKPIMFNPVINKPYFCIINDYSIMLYEKESHTRSTPHDFYGINKFLEKSWINFKETKFKLGFLNSQSWNYIITKFMDAAVRQRLKNLTTLFRAMYEHKFHSSPSMDTIQIFIKSALNNDLKLGVKYLKENLLNAMNNTLKVSKTKK